MKKKNDPDAAFAFNPRRKFLILIPFGMILVGMLLSQVIDFTKYPTAALDGFAWDKGWEMLGLSLGVEKDPAGFTLDTNATILAGDDVWYATWTSGEEKTVTGESGSDVTVHEAQIYLLLYGCADADYAAANRDDFITRTKGKYEVLSEEERTVNGVTWKILDLKVTSETNPYARGASAFAIYKNYAVSAELTCLDSYTGDPMEILGTFLSQCHFSAE